MLNPTDQEFDARVEALARRCRRFRVDVDCQQQTRRFGDRAVVLARAQVEFELDDGQCVRLEAPSVAGALGVVEHTLERLSV